MSATRPSHHRGHHRPLMPTITIVVPARNEARNLEVVLPELPSVHQVVVVDGHSSDDTRAVVARLRPDADFVQQTRKGKGNALACGFEAATGDIIVMFDADGSAAAAEIDAFVAALRDGADFAKGSRVLATGGSEDITPLRDLGNRALTLVTNLLFRTRYSDLCYGYNAFWRDILPVLDLPSAAASEAQWGDGFEIETMINCRVATGALSISEVPSVELPRLHGASNLNTFRDGARVLRTIVSERVRRRRVRPVIVPDAGRVGPSAQVHDAAVEHPVDVHSRRPERTRRPEHGNVIDLNAFEEGAQVGHRREETA
jgi:glycosyltransferase involved in cell wall biosynthesis